MKNNKLETALIEVGKRVDKIKNTPQLRNIDEVYKEFYYSVMEDEMKNIKKNGIELLALIAKLMIDKL